MTRASILACLLLAGCLAAQDCGVCDGRHFVSCVPCRGEGVVASQCASCDGSGSRDCRTCGKIGNAATRLLDPKNKKTLRKGRIDCPSCSAGKIHRVESKTKLNCKLCRSSGHLDCPDCHAGAIKCRCRGRLAEAVCRQCAGAGKLACPGCRLRLQKGECLLCKGEAQRGCATCNNVAVDKLACGKCLGKRKVSCKSCSAVGKIPCKTCRATGVRFDRERKGRKLHYKKSRCGACKGKGTRSCGDCKSGKVGCDQCDGGKKKNLCGRCNGGQVKCFGCASTNYPGLHVMGQLLVDEERYEKAVAIYEQGLKWCESDIKRLDTRIAKLDEILKDLAKPDPKKRSTRRAPEVRRQKKKHENEKRLLDFHRGRMLREVKQLREWLPKEKADQ